MSGKRKSLLRDILQVQISQTSGENFNILIDKIFHIVFGENYKSIKQKKDLGSDGIIQTEKISIACYAPENYVLRTFKRKIKDDYKKYNQVYKDRGYKFLFITNQQIRGNIKIFFDKLCSDSDIWGRDELIEFILRQPPSIRRRILQEAFSNIPEEFIIYDVIEEMVEELITRINTENIAIIYEDPINLFKKIDINFKNEIYKEALKREAGEIYPKYQYYIKVTLEAFGPEQIDTLKARILEDFRRLSLCLKNFEEIYTELIKEYSKKYPNDNEYGKVIQMLLLYILEQCLIGKKDDIATS